jgi:putative oxidoreductase
MGDRRDTWFRATPHQTLRSVELVRVCAAIIVLAHPLHALLHPADAAQLAAGLAAKGVPQSTLVAWAGLALLLLSGLGLLVRRVAARAALVAMGVIFFGSALLYAPRWYVLGGEVEDGAPGVEFSAVLLVALASVALTWRTPDLSSARRASARGLQWLGAASALAMLTHGYGPFVRLDVEGMHAWGVSMTQRGFPYGVALVWSLKGLEAVSSLARLFRRLVVPACVGHLLILVPGMVISQRLDWFDLGPGEGGIEYPVLLAACTFATLLAYWPRRSQAGAVILES